MTRKTRPRTARQLGSPRAALLWFSILIASQACGGGAPEEPAPEPRPPEAVERADEADATPADTTPTPEHVALPPADTVEAPVDSVPLPSLVRFCAMGDMLIGNNLDTLWAGRASGRVGYYVEPFPDPDVALAPLKPLIDDADVVLVNVEGAIGEGDAPSKCRPGSTRCYAFRQPTRTAAAYRRFGDPAAIVGNVANNHALDAGVTGYGETIAHLRRAGVYVTGSDTLATLIPTPALEDTVAVLGFSPFIAGPDPRDLESVRRAVARAAALTPFVVVTMHMGAEGRTAQRTPNETERVFGEDRGNSVAFAHAAVEAGAVLVIGHGPHVLRGAEWVGDALVVYSLGNTLTYGPFNLREPSNRGAIACATLSSERATVDAVLRSAWQRPPGIVAADPSHRGAALVDSLSALDFPETGVAVMDDSVIVRRESPRSSDGTER